MPHTAEASSESLIFFVRQLGALRTCFDQRYFDRTSAERHRVWMGLASRADGLQKETQDSRALVEVKPNHWYDGESGCPDLVCSVALWYLDDT